MRKSHFTVLFDACVFYPAPLRDFLMRLSLTGSFRAKWTEQIHEEWKRNLLDRRADITREQLDRTSELMNRAVSDSLVTGYEHLIEGLELPDPNDRHVLAAAIRCSASTIVTFNLKDFPQETLSHFDIEALHPDEFTDDLFDLDQSAVLEAAHGHRASLKNPPFTSGDYLGLLRRQGLGQTVHSLATYIQIL
ncbi:PIN domain-containing protein [Larsenimonas rhizosphaerae]|uniref:PIN domain-containing protein n=1 Tax=Larsenimonas rhizosphaerae TaxID=2944682 RepID=A0AA41ZH71_9GAMM|nr:PIN domain-containing protein [Larsenimonas rhizosphaerae]MCX2525189.1 PIN domain-containing protein [Larsenimonas rhizosphaerae]